MENQILRIENLSKSFDGLKLFEGASVSLRRGTISGLFGGNGSGKTTLFNMIGGYDRPDAGRILFNDLVIRFHNESFVARAGIGKMWQNPMVFPNHTALENLMVSDKTHPGEYLLNYLFRNRSIKRKEAELKDKAQSILNRFKLGSKLNEMAGSLSLGERKLLSISMLLMNDAELLLLDEPFSGVNSNTIERISIALEELKIHGKTIFMIEHKIIFAEAISDQLFKIEDHQIHPWKQKR